MYTTGATLNDIVIKGDNLTAGATDFIASSANFSVDTAGTAAIVGTSGADTLVGDANDNIITGGDGDDTMTGSGGHDIFDFNLSTLGNTDTISDFILGAEATADTDKLDLSDLLSYTTGDDLAHFIQVLDGGTDVTLNIDKDGESDFTTPEQIIILEGIGTGSLDLAALTADDNLVVL